MRQARFGPAHPHPARELSGVSQYRGLTVNWVIVSCSLWLLSSPQLVEGLHRFSAWVDHGLRMGRFGHLPGVVMFIAIASLVLFVQEVEKRRRQKP